MNKCIKIRMNNEREYFNDDFMNYINEKKNIRLKFIIVENSQINEIVERLNQKCHETILTTHVIRR